MNDHRKRLAALRAGLRTAGLDGFVVPLADEHLSEYVGLYARRLEWLTGFSGSAGTAIVLANEAAIFVDGRYTIQVRREVDPDLYAYVAVTDQTPLKWLEQHLAPDMRIGHDPWLCSIAFAEAADAALRRAGAQWVPVQANPIDAIWTDRPAPSAAPACIHPLEYAGRSSADKRADIAQQIRALGADHLVLGALDEVAWLFNIRGSDVPRTPVVRAFGLLAAEGRAVLCIDAAKIDDSVRAQIGADVALHPYDAFAELLGALPDQARVLVDPQTAACAIAAALQGRDLVRAPSPIILAKAVKNEIELAGARRAHRRDGAAMARFLQWLDAAVPSGTVDELSAQERLEAFRRDGGELVDLSFDTISGYGANGAVVHYRAAPATNQKLAGDGLYLVDSGGQYRDGTTDITRTIAVGQPTATMRDRFTRVLKGHIALATARFPRGTKGSQLDVLARLQLWAEGLDYAHGTGHGVGSFLSVHEGPQRISAAGGDQPLLPGMIISNEPGYYEADHFGIRIENLVAVREDPRPGDTRPMLAFDTLTLAPIDRRLIDPALLSPAEIAWVDAYHARVRDELSPLLDASAQAALDRQTRPLAAPAG
jgi:Xaa-Pro aminopeptidase